jgi:hypothetical protein
MTALGDGDRDSLAELSPALRRAVELDARGLARIRLGGESAAVLVRLPFGVLVARTVAIPTRGDRLDVVVGAADVLAWLDGTRAEPPVPRDTEWRTGLPPATGWRRVDVVPDEVVRGLVRSGALAVQAAAEREGVPGAQPRAEVTDALLDSTVLTVTDDAGTSAEVTLRALSALTRMGFLPRGGDTAVDVSGRWIRVVGGYGTVYLERPGGLVLR